MIATSGAFSRIVVSGTPLLYATVAEVIGSARVS